MFRKRRIPPWCAGPAALPLLLLLLLLLAPFRLRPLLPAAAPERAEEARFMVGRSARRSIRPRPVPPCLRGKGLG